MTAQTLLAIAAPLAMAVCGRVAGWLRARRRGLARKPVAGFRMSDDVVFHRRIPEGKTVQEAMDEILLPLQGGKAAAHTDLSMWDIRQLQESRASRWRRRLRSRREMLGGAGNQSERVQPAALSRAALGAAARVLPASARSDRLDEWVDDVESARAAGRGVTARTLSIIVSAIPREAWRAYMPTGQGRPRGSG